MGRFTLLFTIFGFGLGNVGAVELSAYANRTCDDYRTKDELVKLCTDMFHGVVDGSRCFFVPDRANWTDSWSLCREHGGEFAQIHTESEWLKIWAHVWNVGAGCCQDVLNNVWIPMYQCVPNAIETNTTYWYQNATTPNLALNAGSTFIGTAGRFFSTGGQCVCIARDAYFAFRDCNTRNHVLCEYTGLRQNYIKTMNVCMAETPVEEIDGINPKACGKSCTQRNWCRSFNFLISSKKCQLFCRSIRDTKPNNPKTTNETQNCFHYNYEADKV